MKEVEDNNVYLALDNHKSDEFIGDDANLLI